MKKITLWMTATLAGVCVLVSTGCSTLKPSPERQAQMEATPWGQKSVKEASHDKDDKGAGVVAGLLQLLAH